MVNRYEPAIEPTMTSKFGLDIKVIGRVLRSSRGSRDAAAIVAASDATHRVERMADYRCSGAADDVEIQEAIDYLPA